jgi:uncharacterized membrane protein HdeD (DUF308 family)
MNETATLTSTSWLTRYYYTRGLVAAAWVAAAFTLGKNNPSIAGALLIAYPVWDALANLVDARQSGGLGRNPTQSFNFIVSAATAIAVAIALGHSGNAVFAVFGIWAGLAGILQLVTGVRRWKSFGAQWAMILSGAQSALAGLIFFKHSHDATTPGITGIAPYAGFGAFYFLLSAVLLTISSHRRALATHTA